MWPVSFPQTCIWIVKLWTPTYFTPYLKKSFLSSLIWTLLITNRKCRGLLLHQIRINDEGSARRRDLYLTTHNIHKREGERDISAPNGIRMRNSNKRAAADSHLRPSCHRDLCDWKLLVQPQLNLLKVIRAPVSNFVAAVHTSAETVACFEVNKESCSREGDKNAFVSLYKFANKKVTHFCLSIRHNKGQ